MGSIVGAVGSIIGGTPAYRCVPPWALPPLPGKHRSQSEPPPPPPSPSPVCHCSTCLAHGCVRVYSLIVVLPPVSVACKCLLTAQFKPPSDDTSMLCHCLWGRCPAPPLKKESRTAVAALADDFPWRSCMCMCGGGGGSWTGKARGPEAQPSLGASQKGGKPEIAAAMPRCS